MDDIIKAFLIGYFGGFLGGMFVTVFHFIIKKGGNKLDEN